METDFISFLVEILVLDPNVANKFKRRKLIGAENPTLQ